MTPSPSSYPRWRRYLLYAGLVALLLLLYAPFRCVAEKYNSVTTIRGDFLYPLSVVLWPSYILLFAFSASAGGSLLRVHVALRVAVVVLVIAWFDYSAAMDPWLGVPEGWGRHGLDITVGSAEDFTTTKLSQWLCTALVWVGVLLGEATGFVVKHRGHACNR